MDSDERPNVPADCVSRNIENSIPPSVKSTTLGQARDDVTGVGDELEARADQSDKDSDLLEPPSESIVDAKDIDSMSTIHHTDTTSRHI